ncbi:hypothetical protein DdX_22468 [Ditylenchus destructor]|uniref:Uncharacterized protein n=1 Tax=Ditylenchus destructor TaxID=166010 RepID=A0AAD4QSH2_9BILA|nr:hypothetical protein DdX_22468 [Ditylenchus destructor]
MDNQRIYHHITKRRRVNSFTTDQNQLSPHKSVTILDDTWLSLASHMSSVVENESGFSSDERNCPTKHITFAATGYREYCIEFGQFFIFKLKN